MVTTTFVNHYEISSTSMSYSDVSSSQNTASSGPEVSFDEYERPVVLYNILHDRSRNRPMLLKRNMPALLSGNATGKTSTATSKNRHDDAVTTINLKQTVSLKIDEHWEDGKLSVKGNRRPSAVTVFCIIGYAHMKSTELQLVNASAVSLQPDSTSDITLKLPITSDIQDSNIELRHTNMRPVLMMMVWNDHPDLTSLGFKLNSLKKLDFMQSDRMFSIIPENAEVLWDCIPFPVDISNEKCTLYNNENVLYRKYNLQMKWGKLHFCRKKSDDISSVEIDSVGTPYLYLDPCKVRNCPVELHTELKFWLNNAKLLGNKKAMLNRPASSINGLNSGDHSVLFQYFYGKKSSKKVERSFNFQCPFCLNRYYSLTGLQRHLDASHDLFSFEYSNDDGKHVISVYPPDDSLFDKDIDILTSESKHVNPTKNVNPIYDQAIRRQFLFCRSDSSEAELVSRTSFGNRSKSVQTQAKDNKHERSSKLSRSMKDSKRKREVPVQYNAVGGKYYHSRTGVEMTQEEVDGDEDSDSEQIDALYESRVKNRLEICTVSAEVEKDFMLKWNMHILKQKKPIATKLIAQNNRAFINQYINDINSSYELKDCMMNHLLVQWDHGILTNEDFRNLMQMISFTPLKVERSITKEAISAGSPNGDNGSPSIAESRPVVDENERVSG